MKKVLLISHAFIEKERPGSVRARGLAKYLKKYGWEPTIITIQSNVKSEDEFNVIETKYEDFLTKWKFTKNDKEISVRDKLNSSNQSQTKSKIIDISYFLFREIYAYPDAQKNWFEPAMNAGIDLLEQEKFDAIISTSPPHTSHLIACELKKMFRIQWIADLRDLWSQDTYSDNHFFFRKYLDKKLELKTLKNANAITTTTHNYAKILEKLHGKQTYPILTGFDPNLTFHAEPLINNLGILHAGHLYDGKRNPEPLFKALYELNNENKINVKDFCVQFYGPRENWLMPLIKQYKLENIVKVYKSISKNEIILKEAESQLLLLFTGENPKSEGTIPSKLFEYLAVERPILSIGFSKNVVKDLLKSTNSGVHIKNDCNELKHYIEKFYREFKSNGKIEYKGMKSEIYKYTQDNMAKEFVYLLNRI